MSAPPGMNLVLSEKWLMDYAMKQQVRALHSASLDASNRGLLRRKRSSSIYALAAAQVGNVKADFLKKLTHLKLEDKSIAKIQALEACEKVRVLYLFDNCIRRIENLGFARSLTHLYLQNNQITKIEGLETLGNLTKLCVPRPMLTLPVVALSLCRAARARSRG